VDWGGKFAADTPQVYNLVPIRNHLWNIIFSIVVSKSSRRRRHLPVPSIAAAFPSSPHHHRLPLASWGATVSTEARSRWCVCPICAPLSLLKQGATVSTEARSRWCFCSICASSTWWCLQDSWAPSRSRHSALNIALGEIGKQGARLDDRWNSTTVVNVYLEQSTNSLYQDMHGFRYMPFFSNLMKIDLWRCNFLYDDVVIDIKLCFWICYLWLVRFVCLRDDNMFI
jgi:hypothetical protein